MNECGGGSTRPARLQTGLHVTPALSGNYAALLQTILPRADYLQIQWSRVSILVKHAHVPHQVNVPAPVRLQFRLSWSWTDGKSWRQR